MSADPNTATAQAETGRVRRLLEETYDRYATADEAARGAALDGALREALRTVPEAVRPAVLRALEVVYPAPPVMEAGSSADVTGEPAAAARRLEDLDAAKTVVGMAPPPPPPAPPPPDPLGPTLAGALLGRPAGRGALAAPDAEQRLVAIVEALAAFASTLARSFLAVGLDGDRTMAGHLQGVVADELSGAQASGGLAVLLEQMRRQIGGQVLAFREACDVGAREVLRQVDPAALSASIGASGMFYYRKCWEAFEARYDELRRADNVFETFFDVAFQREMRRLLTEADGSERSGSGKR